MKSLLYITIFFGTLVSFAQAQQRNGDRKFYVKVIVLDTFNMPLSSVDLRLPFGPWQSSENGEFQFHLPQGSTAFNIRKLGYQPRREKVYIKNDSTINVILSPLANQERIEAITVHGKKRRHSQMMKAGTINEIDRETVEKMPSFLGEKDVIRTLQMMPGMSFAAEGSAEIYARGGSADQNLILLDGVPMYNSTHLLGLFSAVNPLVVNNAKLFTGAFPTWYGGKLSSVIDIKSREADFNTFSGSAEIGLTSGKGHLEIPLVKNKLSLLLAGRRSFFDAIRLLGTESIEYFNFFDANAILTYKPDTLNTFKLSGYLDGDKFAYESNYQGEERDASIKHQQAFAFNWNRIITKKLNLQFNTYYSRFRNLLLEEQKSYAGEESHLHNFHSQMRTIGAKATVNFEPTQNFQTLVGLAYNSTSSDPSNYYGHENEEPFSIQSMPTTRSQEIAAFGELFYTWRKTSLHLGSRILHYKNSGFSRGYVEPRVSIHQDLGHHLGVKASYSRMTQPLQRLLNTGMGLPTDIVFPSDAIIIPPTADIFTIGLAKDILISERNYISFSIEAYQKYMANITTFKDGYDTYSAIQVSPFAIYRASSVYDMLLSEGNGRVKGIDMKVDGAYGRFSGWLSYSLSHAEHQFQELNAGKWFNANTDRRHLLNLALTYRLSPKWSISGAWMYGSGNPIHLPESYYGIAQPKPINELQPANQILYAYGERNSYRMKPFHKLDVSMTKQTTVFRKAAELNFGVYNIYNRANPSFYFLDLDRKYEGTPQLKSISVFPVMPSISLKVNF